MMGHLLSSQLAIDPGRQPLLVSRTSAFSSDVAPLSTTPARWSPSSWWGSLRRVATQRHLAQQPLQDLRVTANCFHKAVILSLRSHCSHPLLHIVCTLSHCEFSLVLRLGSCHSQYVTSLGPHYLSRRLCSFYSFSCFSGVIESLWRCL